ncbi:hypothetical protein P175DRAFT_0528128 [Aspergillus ochraceoroseus IBT 24754]|uniref:Uncharacterized protein n=1 Tax=Aspergillus ochraceoroseus IBT 24754 TaxID=1392256 RepID=A0A2T5M7W0_9EURO|nr:uncharacterized protein P175DRAFT_0528128 [Aspergillus ochraceoroseus IBT 24754]PTU24630.1 hypothetical protein P175DRAFT_0528128 [Aspergillus ochraceoroseus IBT 24754]
MSLFHPGFTLAKPPTVFRYINLAAYSPLLAIVGITLLVPIKDLTNICLINHFHCNFVSSQTHQKKMRTPAPSVLDTSHKFYK